MGALTKADAEAILNDVFAPWVLELGLSVEEVSDDAATLRMVFSDKLCRVGGTICGQALVSAGDTAMVIAASAALGAFLPIGTVDMTVNFMRPVANTDILIKARVMRLGTHNVFLQCHAVRCVEDGKECAHIVGTYAVPPKK